MSKTITIVTRYNVTINGATVNTVDTIDEAVEDIVGRNHDRMDDEIMSRPGVSNDDTPTGLNEAAYNRAWDELKAEIAAAADIGCYAYTDELYRHYAIKPIRAVKVESIGSPDYIDIEIEEDDWCYGTPVATDVGDVALVRRLNDDTDIRVYEAVSLKDGHRDVIAADNATNWCVGSDDDETNRSHFDTLDGHGVRWHDIEDSDLADYIEERRAAAGYEINHD